MKIAKQDSFGKILFLKRLLHQFVGIISYSRYCKLNKLHIEGSEIIRSLPDTNVLFVSNHQTYFADVTAMLHVFNASLKGHNNTLKNFNYLWKPKLNIYFIAAKETMSSSLLSRVLSYGGAISVERTWRCRGNDILEKKAVNPQDVKNIQIALQEGWVITFPQGTTRPFNPIRKGTVHIILQNKPIVIPIVIDGFRRSFNKKGLLIKKRGVVQSIIIKKPLDIDFDKDTVDDIVDKIGYAIEQHPSFLKVSPISKN